MKKTANEKWKKMHINKDSRRVRFVENVQKMKGKDESEKENPKPQKVDQPHEMLKIIPKRTINEQQEREKNKNSVDAVFVDNRCRYWIQQRIGDMMNANAFTTKSGYSFAVDVDQYAGGLCFRFARNGTEVARIDSNGYLYCSNAWLNGVNVLNILNSIRDEVGGIGADLSQYVKHKQLKNGSYVMDVKDITATSASINSTLSCNSLSVATDANINGLLNGCNIATTTLSTLGTLPMIPVIKSDSKMEIGRYLDFHYNASDDYTARLESSNNGTLQVTNSKSVIDTMDLFSNNSNRVEFHVGRSNTSNKCAVIQYNVNPVSLGFGFYNNNDIMNLDTNGNLSVNGTITSPTITTINNAIDGKAPLSHTHSSNDITDLDNAIDTRFRLILADLIYPVGIIVCFYQSLETLGATVWRRNPLVYLWNYMLWEFLPDDVFIRNGFKNSDGEEDGATMTPAGSDTHTHTTGNHTLTRDEIPSHAHDVLGSKNTQTGTNPTDCMSIMNYGEVSDYWERNNWNWTYTKSVGGGQAHNHGNTGSASNVPTHIVAYFYRRI